MRYNMQLSFLDEPTEVGYNGEIIMKAKRDKYLYLYLALVCFVGILAIFIIDGYLGTYDTVYITSQEREQKIEPDYWEHAWAKEQGYTTGVAWGEPIQFRYEIDNRGFTSYPTEVRASLWKGGEKITDLLNKDITVPAFKRMTVEWILKSQELKKVSADVSGYTIKINRGEVERKIVLNFFSTEGLPYPKPVTIR